MEDDRVGHQKLLVARNNERGGKIYGQMRCLSKVQEPKRGTSRKANAQCNPRKTMESYIGRFYHQTAPSLGIRCNPGSM